VLKRIREISYDSAEFHGSGFEARYSTDTGIELRIRSELVGLGPEAYAAIDTDRYARVWGLASFGHVFGPLLPIRLDVKALSLESAEEERWRSWFLGSLSENLYRSGLPAELDLTFSGDHLAPREPLPGLEERAILMSGGGKDSVVSAELLNSLGVPFTWYTFSPHGRESGKQDPASRDIAEISGNSSLITSSSRSEIRGNGGSEFKGASPQRLRRSYFWHGKRHGGLKWLSMMSQTVESCLVGEATGSRYVLTGNERSANEGNGIRIGNLDVNHQYTKSYAFESEFSSFLTRYLHPDLRHASLLMPFYELQIGKMFASYPEYFGAFRSCNRRTARDPWCLECPKCAFVFLLLSAYVDEETVQQIFKADLLNDPKLVQTFLDLCGRGEYKPLECVGERDESLLALYFAAKRRTATPLHPALIAILPEAVEADRLQTRFLDAYNDDNGLSAHWNDKLRQHTSGLSRSVAGPLVVRPND